MQLEELVLEGLSFPSKLLWAGGPRAQGRVWEGASGPAEQGPSQLAIFHAQEKSYIGSVLAAPGQ